MTVAGEIHARDMGFTQCHEHLALSQGQSWKINPALCIDIPQRSILEVRRFREAGGSTVVEAQPVGCGRVADGLRMISLQTGVHIICSTGFHKLCFYPENHWIHKVETDVFSTIMTGELLVGTVPEEAADNAENAGELECLEPTQVKAGIIKTALDAEGLTPRYLRLFEAAALSASDADVNVMIHVENGADPRILQSFFTDRGIGAERLMFCHMDRACTNLKLHRDILMNGSYLEYDTIGRFKYHSDEEEILIIRKMVSEGYGKQLLYSLDTTAERLKSYNPEGIGLDYILRIFNNKLLRAGIEQDEIRRISEENPARFFSG